MSFQFRDIGGGAIMAWQAVVVENNCSARGPFPDCDGTDRLTVLSPSTLTSTSSFIECRLLNPYQVGSAVNARGMNGDCCINGEIVNKSIALVSGDWLDILFVRSADLNQCLLSVESHRQGTILRRMPSFGRLELPSLLPVSVKTYFTEMSLNRLQSVVDTNNDFTIAPSEVSEVASQIYDLQFVLGYDKSMRDGKLTEDGTDQDEWLYNSASDVWQQRGLAGARPYDLQGLGISILTGEEMQNTIAPETTSLAIQDGPSRTYTKMATNVLHRKIFLRNAVLFE